MLYQTHHHPFHFKPFFTSAIHTIPHFPSLSSSQVEIQEMACTEVALKGSFRKETTLKSNQLEDLYGQNSVEDFSVDDLLDFSKMDEKENDGEQDKSCVFLSSPKPQLMEKFATHVGNLHDFGSTELNVPVDDVANLEWLSNFVDDSFSDYSLTFPAGNLEAKPKNSPEKLKLTPPAKIPCFACPVPAKARTKRTRTGGPRWSFGSSTDSSTSSSNSSTSSISSPSSSWLIYTTPINIVDSFNSLTGPQTKKPRRRRLLTHNIGGVSAAQQPRRCSHCGVQKTPQWRAGPLGAKTLCNACGVRFKSGRLLPEYRPACSPTFSSEVHSNNHRKVLEMRKKKESDGPEPGLGPVASF